MCHQHQAGSQETALLPDKRAAGSQALFTHQSHPKVAAGLSLGSMHWSCCCVICMETGAAVAGGSTGADGIDVLNMGKCTSGKNRAYTVASSSPAPMKFETGECKLKASAASCRCSGELCPWLSTSPSRIHPHQDTFVRGSSSRSGDA